MRTPHMKKLVDEIHWNTTCIQEYLPNIHIKFLWTKSPFECLRNHNADYLALCGRQRLKRRQPIKEDWHYITLGAVCNRNKELIKTKVQREL